MDKGINFWFCSSFSRILFFNLGNITQKNKAQCFMYDINVCFDGSAPIFTGDGEEQVDLVLLVLILVLIPV